MGKAVPVTLALPHSLLRAEGRGIGRECQAQPVSRPVREFFGPVREFFHPAQLFFHPMREFFRPVREFYGLVREFYGIVREFFLVVREFFLPLNCMSSVRRGQTLHRVWGVGGVEWGGFAMWASDFDGCAGGGLDD